MVSDFLGEIEQENCIDINLRFDEFPSGATYRFGDVFVTMVSGFYKPPTNWDIANSSEERNAGSIVIRVMYKGKSVLLCGDAVGRHIGYPNSACLATEQYMVDNAVAIPIDSDVIEHLITERILIWGLPLAVSLRTCWLRLLHTKQR